MVWACSPLGLWLSKTKQEDTQSVTSQLSHQSYLFRLGQFQDHPIFHANSLPSYL
ncbi:Uncharacterised protein [Chlamydia abortus]|nr:Uncharacterised protein [Chlamydia abortus]